MRGFGGKNVKVNADDTAEDRTIIRRDSRALSFDGKKLSAENEHKALDRRKSIKRSITFSNAAKIRAEEKDKKDKRNSGSSQKKSFRKQGSFRSLMNGPGAAAPAWGLKGKNHTPGIRDKKAVEDEMIGRAREAVSQTGEATETAAIEKLKNKNATSMTELGLIVAPPDVADIFLIHPYSRYLLIWQCVLVVMIIYNMLFVPFELAFGKDNPIIVQAQGCKFASDAIFITDILLAFNIMIAVEQLDADRTLIIDDRRVIAREYLAYQFWVDLLSVGLPFDSDELIASETGAPVTGLKALNLIKLIRIFKAYSIFEKHIALSPSVKQRFNVLGIMMLMFYVSHALACMFYKMTSLNTEANWRQSQFGDAYGDHVKYCNQGVGNPADKGVPDDANTTYYELHQDNCDQLLRREYVAAFYWAMMTMTTVGYGDVSAQNEIEQIFSVVVMVGGAVLYAVMLGSVTASVQELISDNTDTVVYQKSVERFIKHYKLSTGLANRLRQTTMLQLQWTQQQQMNELFEHYHPEFKAELMLSIHRPVMIKNSFFRGISDAFMKKIVTQLRLHVCLAHDCVYKEGDDGDRMFMLNQGMVGLYSEELRVDLLEPGDAFGEGAVLTKLLSRRLETANAEVRCVIHSLTREDLGKAADCFPQVQGLLEKKVIVMLQKRQGEKMMQLEKQEKQELLEGAEEKKDEMEIRVDVMQARGLGSKKEVANANFYCLLLMHVPCQECRALAEGKVVEIDAPSANQLARIDSKRSFNLKRRESQDKPRAAVRSHKSVLVPKSPAAKAAARVPLQRANSATDAAADEMVATLVGGAVIVDTAAGPPENRDDLKNAAPDLAGLSPKMVASLRMTAKLARKTAGTPGKKGPKVTQEVRLLKDFGQSFCCSKCKVRQFSTQAKSRNLNPNWNEHFVIKLDSEDDFLVGKCYCGIYHKSSLMNEHIAGLEIKYRMDSFQGVHWWSLSDRMSGNLKLWSKTQSINFGNRRSSEGNRRASEGILKKQGSRWVTGSLAQSMQQTRDETPPPPHPHPHTPTTRKRFSASEILHTSP
jgi:CRP-like cAMP-binding protein